MYQQLGVTHENEFAVYNAVECSDAAWPRNWARWDADTRKVSSVAPFEAWGNAWFNAACAFWPVRGPAQPMKIGAAGLPGILMLQGTLDAATPYAGAQQARRALGTARMVVGHRRRQPRPVAGQPAEHVRERLPGPLPGHRRAAGRNRGDGPPPARRCPRRTARPASGPAVPPRVPGRGHRAPA